MDLNASPSPGMPQLPASGALAPAGGGPLDSAAASSPSHPPAGQALARHLAVRAWLASVPLGVAARLLPMLLRAAAAPDAESEAAIRAAREDALDAACAAGIAGLPAFAGWQYLGHGEGHLVFDVGGPDVLKISREYRDAVRHNRLFGQADGAPVLPAALLRVRESVALYNDRVERLRRHVGADHVLDEQRFLAEDHPFPVRILNAEVPERQGLPDDGIVHLPLVMVSQPKFSFGPDVLELRWLPQLSSPEFNAEVDDALYAEINRLWLQGTPAAFDADLYARFQGSPAFLRVLERASTDRKLHDEAVAFAIAMLDYEDELLDYGGPLNAILEPQADGNWRYLLVGVLMENDSVITERDGVAALRKATDGIEPGWREKRNLVYFLNVRRNLHALLHGLGVEYRRPLPPDLARRDIDWANVRRIAQQGRPRESELFSNPPLARLPRAPWGGGTFRYAAP